jgi:hypothetical protein
MLIKNSSDTVPVIPRIKPIASENPCVTSAILPEVKTPQMADVNFKSK